MYMNIYISHSREFNFKNEWYNPLRKSDFNKEHNLILPHEKSDMPFPIKKLLKEKFGTVANIRKTSLDELAAVVGEHIAQLIQQSL